MTRSRMAAGGLFACALLIPTFFASAQAASDAFAAACMANGKRRASSCDCQAKLARAHLDARERRAAIAGLRGGQPALRKEVTAMGEKRARIFLGKMDQLGARARQTCR